MHRFLLGVCVVSLLGLGVALVPSQVRAAGECNMKVTGMVSGGLTIHAGDNCDVEGATVSGGIFMDGGTLTVCGSTVNGGISVAVAAANSASAWADLGNLELGCGGNNLSGGVFIDGAQGHIPTDEQGASAEFEHNVITGGLALTNNGLVEVESNTVDGGCFAIGNAAISNFFNFQGPNVYTGGNLGCPG
jgi:hypothetical protein